MNILIVTDAYPPMRTSGAVHIYDLAQAFIQSGSKVTILIPDSAQSEKVVSQLDQGIQVIRIKAFQTKDVAYWKRLLAELINPYVMWYRLQGQPELLKEQINGVVWYSPTIFWGPLIKRLKKRFHAKSYLILRDIFPDWALDLGVIKKGPIYTFLKAIEFFQYQQATCIGVQSPNNQAYFLAKYPQFKSKAEVLWNWGHANPHQVPCSINLSASILAGRTLCIYAGNMGVAQDMDGLLDVAHALKNRQDLGFILVGRGSEVGRLAKRILDEKLENVLLFNEITSDEVTGLYAQCHIGIVILDARHTTHNIPGKWIGYLHAGLPTYALVNPQNDMIELISQNQLGFATSSNQLEDKLEGLIHLQNQVRTDPTISNRCQLLGNRLFSSQGAANQIIHHFSS